MLLGIPGYAVIQYFLCEEIIDCLRSAHVDKNLRHVQWVGSGEVVHHHFFHGMHIQ